MWLCHSPSHCFHNANLALSRGGLSKVIAHRFLASHLSTLLQWAMPPFQTEPVWSQILTHLFRVILPFLGSPLMWDPVQTQVHQGNLLITIFYSLCSCSTLCISPWWQSLLRTLYCHFSAYWSVPPVDDNLLKAGPQLRSEWQEHMCFACIYIHTCISNTVRLKQRSSFC